MASKKQSSKKKTRKRSRTTGPKYMSILEEDFVLQFGPNRSINITQQKTNSKCIVCFEEKASDTMIFINCKKRGYRMHPLIRMNCETNRICEGENPLCKVCHHRIKQKPCPNCRGPCCKKNLKSRRYPKKKKCFAERMVHKERLRKKREKKIKKTILMDLMGVGFKRRTARDLIYHCASEGIKLKLHLWRRRIDTIIYNQMY